MHACIFFGFSFMHLLGKNLRPRWMWSFQVKGQKWQRASLLAQRRWARNRKQLPVEASAEEQPWAFYPIVIITWVEPRLWVSSLNMLILCIQFLLSGKSQRKTLCFLFIFSLKNFLTKALYSSKDQLLALCRGPDSHLILQQPLELLCPSSEPPDCSSNPYLSPLHFLVGFEVFLYFSIFYIEAILVKAWCKQIEKIMSAAEILSAYGTQMCSLSCGSHCKIQKPTKEEGCHSFI